MARDDVSCTELRDDRDLAAYARVLSTALLFPVDQVTPWADRVGRENLRLARRADRVVGGAAIYPAGQWFGGRSVPMGGIAAVAVAAEERGGGVGTTLMADVLRECRRRGLWLSTLYPATCPVYRAVGYETAGSSFLWRLRPEALSGAGAEPGTSVRAMTEADRPAAVDLYARRASATPGHVDRSLLFWRRTWFDRDDLCEAFRCDGDDGAMEGYVVYSQDRLTASSNRYELGLAELVATTGRAARRLLGFLSTHRSMCDSAIVPGGPADALLTLPREEPRELLKVDRWMLRVVDVAEALARRGYPPTVRARVSLDLGEDAVLPENGGRWTLDVEGGAADVRRGGEGRLRLDVGALAALYTGYLSAEALAAIGRVTAADPADLAAASAAFAGPSPWMSDHF